MFGFEWVDPGRGSAHLMNTRVVLECEKIKKEVEKDLLPTLAPLIDQTSSYFSLLNDEVLYRVYSYSRLNQGEIADLTLNYGSAAISM